VTATLTELRRDTSKVIRPAIHAGETVVVTEHREQCAEIIPVRKIDWKQALRDLMATGAVAFAPRK
jgi:antitoxin (DNA-binding transcriptional repressor) of toxin-antitoxin stability system